MKIRPNDYTSNTKIKIHRSKIENYILENNYLLNSYGCVIFKKYMDIKKQSIFCILAECKLSPKLRAKIIDLIMHICLTLNFSIKTYFKTVNIVDMYLTYGKKVDDEIFLSVIASIFIAIKLEETTFEVNLLLTKINTYSLNEILTKEKEILNEIKIENIMNIPILECIYSLFYVFEIENYKFLIENGLFPFIDHLKLFVIYLASLLLHFEEFNRYGSLYIVLWCVVFVLGFIDDKLEQKEKIYIEKWIKSIFNKNPYNFNYSFSYNEICYAIIKYINLDLRYARKKLKVEYKRLRILHNGVKCKICLNIRLK